LGALFRLQPHLAEGFTENLLVENVTHFRDELEARRQKQQEHQDAMLAKQTWLGYMARKQVRRAT
jgi:hypothetical protein